MLPLSRRILRWICTHAYQRILLIELNFPFYSALQEQLAYKGRIVGFGSAQKLINSNKYEDPRAVIYASRSLHIWPMMEFCDRDTAIGPWKTGNSYIDEIVVVSIFIDILLPGVWPAAFERLLDFCDRKKKCGDRPRVQTPVKEETQSKEESV